ncbi:MAG: flavodoxin family protein [Methanomassiliicoccales archaeon]
MKAIIFNGSYRTNGNTAKILRKIAGMFEHHLIEYEWVDLGSLEIEDCRGCLVCKDSNRCCVKDDMQLLYDKIQMSDFLVLGSPIYMGAETGRFKSFIDRLYAFLRFTNEKGLFESSLNKGKKAIIVFTCGRKDGDIVYNHLNVRYFHIFVKLLACEDMRSFIIPVFCIDQEPMKVSKTTPLSQMFEETSRFIEDSKGRTH